MKRPWSVGLLLVVGLVAGAAGATWWLQLQDAPVAVARVAPAEASRPAPVAAAASNRVAVEVAPVTRVASSRQVAAVGTLRSADAVTLRPEIAGRIAEIHFHEGRRVQQGDLLVRLDDSIARAELLQARANFSLAGSQHRRAVELTRQGYISQQARDEAASKLQVAQAAVALAEAQLGKTAIVAPFDGLVGLRNVSVGDYVSAGASLVPLESIDPLNVDFRIPEQYLNQVHPGARLSVTFDALPGQARVAEVSAVSPQVDIAGRSMLLRARVPNEDSTLRPGMFARVNLMFSNEQVLAVPETALAPSGAAQYVFVVEDGRARRVAVTLGERRDGMVEVLDGLQEGVQVMVAGLQKVRDGSLVELVGGPPAGAPAAS